MAQDSLGPGYYLIILLFIFAYLFIYLFYFDSQCEISMTFIIGFLLVRTSSKETESICHFNFCI